MHENKFSVMLVMIPLYKKFLKFSEDIFKSFVL